MVLGSGKINMTSFIIKFLFCFFIITSLVKCGDSKTDQGGSVKPPKNEITNENPEEQPPKGNPTRNPTQAGDTENENTPNNLFEDKECNRFYWTFKCALEFKNSKAHSEECKKNITALYPDDANRLKRIEAQSKNTEQTIKATWLNYFNNNCKDDISVTDNLKQLD